jgi:hypothetical protein
MGRTQLAINIPAPLLERLRAAAAERGVTATSLVLGWIEAGLDAPRSDLAAGLDGSRSDLAARLAAVERRLDALPASPAGVPLGAGTLEIIGANHLHPPAPAAASPERVIPPPRTGNPLPLPERRLTPAEAAGLLTTPEVGKALGLSSDSALTNWIAREASKRGGSAVGGIYRGHRLRGKGLLPGGQKPGWLWEPV